MGIRYGMGRGTPGKGEPDFACLQRARGHDLEELHNYRCKEGRGHDFSLKGWACCPGDARMDDWGAAFSQKVGSTFVCVLQRALLALPRRVLHDGLKLIRTWDNKSPPPRNRGSNTPAWEDVSGRRGRK